MTAPHSLVRRPAAHPPATLLAVGLAFLLVAPPARAQAVDVTLVERGSRAPIPGGIVTIVTPEGARVSPQLSDEAGKAVVRAPGAGRYRLRADRIGYQTWISPELTLAAGDSIAYTAELPPDRVQLEAVTVIGKERCRSFHEGGQQTAALWEEVRKALTANQLTEDDARVRVQARRYERDLDLGFRVVSQEWTPRFETGARPFVTRSPEMLAKDGYASVTDTGTFYFAPDAEILLSDAFLEQHCFRARRGEGPRAGLLGLEFEPVAGIRRPDVQGVLWIDPEAAELRSLDFRYVRPPTRIRSDSVGGRLVFQRLPGGRWIVSEWFIRMPSVELQPSTSSSSGTRERLAGYHESGGQATTLSVPSRIIVPLTREVTITGAVYDSTRSEPLPGVRVTIDGTSSAATTDSAGRYQLQLAGRGTYRLRFSHPRLTLLGLGEPVREIAMISSGPTREEHLGIPGVERLRESICRAAAQPDTGGVLVGRVVHPDGSPAGGTPVILRWRALSRNVAKRAGRPRRTDEISGDDEVTAKTAADGNGVFRVCGLPTKRDVRVRAGGAHEITVKLEEGEIREVEARQR